MCFKVGFDFKAKESQLVEDLQFFQRQHFLFHFNFLHGGLPACLSAGHVCVMTVELRKCHQSPEDWSYR